MAKVCVIGAKGWIGSMLVSSLRERTSVKNIFTPDLRADDIDMITKFLDTLNPTHVISAIGRTHGVIDGTIIPTIDYLEYPGKLRENIRDNLFAPVSLAKICSERGIHLTYLGTGCIFEYDDSHSTGFDEKSKPNFFGSGYSIVKGFTDELISLYSNSVLNVRIRMPITAEPSPRDFITKIVNYEKICSMANSMTVLDDLLPLMVDMALKNRTGTINLTNPGTISHSEILEMYKDIVDPTKSWKTMSYEEQSLMLKSKRSNNKLNTSKLESWYPDVCDIKTAIKNVLEKRSVILKKIN